MEAREKNEEATEKEKIILAISEAQIGDNGYQELNQNNLQEAINSQFGEEKANVIDNGNNTFLINISSNHKTYSIDVNGNVEYNSHLLVNNVKIGDYVDYIPDEVADAYQIRNVGNNSEIFQEKLNWRVFNIKNGKVILISEDTTSSEITLNGADGYNNGVYVLNDLCEKLYSKTGTGIARSINATDIDNISTFDKNDYVNVNGIKFGESNNYSESWYEYYPNQYGKELNENEQSIDNYPTIGYSQKIDGELELKQTGYEYSLGEYISGLEYDLIKKSERYWLASRFTYCGTPRAYFGIQMIGSTSDLFYCSSLYTAGNAPNSSTYHIVPIVELNTNVEINTENFSKNGGTIDSAWEILE